MGEIAKIVAAVFAYLGLLFALARWSERQERRGRRVASNAFVYVLSLTTYCTTWTYYGSVGFATSTGLLFMAVYMGPTLGAALWCGILRKMVRIKNAHRVTSVVDLLSLRYGRSQPLGAIATLGVLAVIVPYVALQLKTMIDGTALLMGRDAATGDPIVAKVVGPFFVCVMIVFTIVFGIRRLSPTERHPGMVVTLAAASVVKLVGFLAVGAFVTFGLFHGFGDVFRRAEATDVLDGIVGPKGSFAGWLSILFESAIAVLFLPRQFHLAVVENSDENHVRTAMWGFPLYLLAINVFVLPIAIGGFLLGHPMRAADTFVLRLPVASGARALSWLVFLGGFSAGMGMVMSETVTIATMVSNHIVLPAVPLFPRLAPVRRHLLATRWSVAAVVLLAAFAYEQAFGRQYDLVSLGLLAHSAVLALAPAILVGLYWRRASTAGAMAGVTTGLVTWAYTLLLPVIVRAGWLPTRILADGPAGISALRPEALFGIGGLDAIPHAVLWIVVFSGAAFIFGSLLFPAPVEEQARAARLVDISEPRLHAREDLAPRPIADAAAKRARIVELFSGYHRRDDAERLADACLEKVEATARPSLSALQLASLESEVETTLASSVGTTAAHGAVKQHKLVTQAEAEAISTAYAKLLAALKVPPADLHRAIDYHRERERFLAHEAGAQRFLSEVSARLATSLDVDATAVTVVSLPVPRLAEASLLWMAGSQVTRALAWTCALDPRGRRTTASAAEPAVAALASQRCIARALESRRPVVNAPQPRPSLGGLLDFSRFSSAATFPLLAGGRTLGTLTLLRSEQHRLRFQQDLAVCEELAHRSAIAIENSMLLRRAEEALRARDEFLAVASHELKTPLTPLQLKIQTLERLVARVAPGVVPARLAEMIRGADQHVERLVVLIDDLLDASHLREQQLHLSPEPTDLGASVRAVVERHESDLGRAGCDVSIAVAREVVGCWDRMRIEQVFTRLLVNAIKYAPGAIDVTIDADEGTARLTVRDHGPGIAPEDRERIFEPFERAASYTSTSGFGLGLHVVRRIVKAHGGTVRLESAPGDGTTFLVELPLRPPMTQTADRHAR